jgi:hypothetical protein
VVRELLEATVEDLTRASSSRSRELWRRVPGRFLGEGTLRLEADYRRRRRGRTLSLLAASFSFGLIYWNNARDPTKKVAYVALATVAGLFYGLDYRPSGNNLLAPVLILTLVDLIWATFFR